MEVNNQKLGKGIIILSIFTLISSVFSILSSITLLTEEGKKTLIESYTKLGIEAAVPSNGQTTIGIIISVLVIVSLILILMKKSVGVYGYFISEIISIISSIIFSGFSIFVLVLMLIFPVLMAIFILKKRNIFGL